MADQPELSIVIPVYNEGTRARRAVEVISAYCRGRGLRAELIIVDDGSDDETVAQVQHVQQAPECPITVLSHRPNQGKGAAVRKGVLAARGERILFCDADLATPIEELEKFEQVLRAHGVDIAIGTRKVAGAVVLRRQPWVREQLGKGFTALTNGITGIQVSDVTCGFKYFTRDAAQAVFRRSQLPGWSFDAEVLFLARRGGFTIREVPVRWQDSGTTKVRLRRDVLGSFFGLIRIRWNALRGVYNGMARG